jgi:subtilisin family serine protease
VNRGLSLAAAGIASLLVLAAGGSASAAPASVYTDGSWYFEALNVGAAHQKGFTGEGVTIAVIDTPLNPDVPTLKNANIEFYDKPLCYLDDAHTKPVPPTSTDLEGVLESRHATSVVSLLVGSGDGYPGEKGVRGVAPDARVLFYSMAQTDEAPEDREVDCKRPDAEGKYGQTAALAEAMMDAMDRGADIISVSMLALDDVTTDKAIIRAVNEGVVIVAGLRNDSFGLYAGFPGTANGVVSVQAIDSDVNILTSNGFENTDSHTDIVAPGVDLLTQGTQNGGWEAQRLTSGTSLATPIVAGFLAVVKQKYPDATGNQLMQTLIHNTGRDDGKAVFDETNTYGYGTASLTVMLEADPTQYPDENPFVSEAGFPTPDMIFAEPTEEPTAAPQQPQDDPITLSSVVLFVAIALGGLILIGVIVLVVVLATRRARAAARTHDQSQE